MVSNSCRKCEEGEIETNLINSPFSVPGMGSWVQPENMEQIREIADISMTH